MNNSDTCQMTSSLHESERLALHGGKPVRTEKFGPRWDIGDEEKAQLMEVIDRAATSWRSGFKVREFTNRLQLMYGVANVVATSSGTGSIHAALGALNPEPGQEVITTAVTDIGSLIGILQHNLIPIFADWEETHFNMDPAQIEARITERTCAILVVHLFGSPCDMTKIMEISRRRGIPVIEDCAQAHLATIDGRKVGSIGDIGCFSLGLKTLSTDQGGFVTVNDSALAAAVRGFLSKGSVKIGENWEPYSRLGSFYPMTDLQAAVGVAQLSKLESATEARIRTAAIFDEAFASLDGFIVPKALPGCRHVYYVYPFHIDQARAGVSVSTFVQSLKAEGIIDAFGPYLHGKPLHRFPIFAKMQTYGQSGYPFKDEQGIARIDYNALKLPVAERLLPGLGFFHLRNSFVERDVRDIATAIVKVGRYYAKTRAKGASVAAVPNGRQIMVHAPAPLVELAAIQKDQPADNALGLRTGAHHAVGNSAVINRALAAFVSRGGRLELPQGNFHLSEPIRLEKTRNIELIGAGGNYVNPGTRLIYPGTDCCLHLSTAIHCQVSGLCLVAEHENAHAVVRIDAVEDGPSAVSSLNNSFTNCTFRGVSAAGVTLKDAAHTEFKHCWFQTPAVGIRIGAPMRQPAPTISNGQCNNTVLDNCILFSHVTGVRGSNVTFQNCEFAALKNGDGACIDFGASDDSQICNVAIRDCFAINGGTHRGAFFRQGREGAGLAMSNCRVRGYALAVDLNGLGAALLSTNVFEQTGPGAADIRIKEGLDSVSLVANLHTRTIEAGNVAVLLVG